MTKKEFQKTYDALQTIGVIPHTGLSPLQVSLIHDAYNQLFDLLTDFGNESLASAADKLGLELV